MPPHNVRGHVKSLTGTRGACGARGTRRNRDEGDDGNHQGSVMGGGASAPGGHMGGAPFMILGGTEFMQGVFTTIEQVARNTVQMMQVPVRATDFRATMAMKAFLQLRPLTFKGEIDPLVAKDWLEQVTRALDTILVTEEELRVLPSIRNKIAENLIKVYSTMVSTAVAIEETLNKTGKIVNPKSQHEGTSNQSEGLLDMTSFDMILGIDWLTNYRAMINCVRHQKDLNLRQRRWMEYMEDYDFELHYHPEKANVVADALSRKSFSTLASISIGEWQMLQDIGEYDLLLNEMDELATLFALSAEPSIISWVIEEQLQDVEAKMICDCIPRDAGPTDWVLHSDQGLRYKSRLFVPLSSRDDVLRKFHHSRLAFHPRGTKMYHDLCCQFWWRRMKKDVALFVSRTWEDHLHLVEFAYNNSYQASIGTAPFEVLYGRPCRSPVCWADIGEVTLAKSDWVCDTTEKGDLDINEDVTYEERPIRVLDTREQVLRGKTIPLVKVLWHHYGLQEAMWERESEPSVKVREVDRIKSPRWQLNTVGNDFPSIKVREVDRIESPKRQLNTVGKAFPSVKVQKVGNGKECLPFGESPKS
ncbi:hypothetical protein Acr_27g0003060 [Actinidia rufa]|uniref:Integrase zinc-binding domain-containing protein n=1 Tax=Actinidia rufa TaxID=165716 RepID=A0A7J0H639_9ERIC|nr:hypothetical protein Acr_27g0003060 [Actinidia rufa]